MFAGQVDVITNSASWTSDFYQIVNEDDGSVINLLNPDIGFDCSVYIGDMSSKRALALATIANGKVMVSDSGLGAGFQWRFSVDDTRSLCPGRYICGVSCSKRR